MCGLVALNGVLLLRHRLWRDEIQAWAIAHQAHSFGRLLDLLRNEGHPPLWYLAVWPFAHLSSSPFSLQILSLVCVAATALIVLRTAPWRWSIRVLLLVGYFTAFEYVVMARGYTLALPLVMGLCAAGWSARRRRWLVVGVLAALVGITSVYGFLAAIAILVGLLTDEWNVSGRDVRAVDWRRIAPGVGVFAIVQLVYLAVWPRSVVTARAESRGLFHAIGLAGTNLSRALWPIPDVRQAFWESNVVVVHAGLAVLGLLGAILALAVLWALRGSLPGLVTWVVGTIVIGAFSGLTGQGAMQFAGHAFLLTVAAFWAASCAGTTATSRADAATASVPATSWLRSGLLEPNWLRSGWLEPKRRLTTVFVSLLALQTVAFAVVLPQAVTRPFSNLEPVASRLQRLPADTLVSADPEPVGGALGVLMHRPVFQVESQATAEYTVWGKEKRCGSVGPDLPCIGPETVLARTRRAAGTRDAVLVTNVPLPPMPGVQPLWSMTGAVVPTEDIWAYRVAPLGAGGAS